MSAVLFLVLTLGCVFQYPPCGTVYRMCFHCRAEFNAVRSLILQGAVLYAYVHEAETVRNIISWIPFDGRSDCALRGNNGVEKSRYLEETSAHSPIDFHETVYFTACFNFA